MKFRFVCFLLAACLFSSNTFISANAASVNSVSATGISLSVSEFSNHFSGNPETRKAALSLSKVSTPKITLSEIVILNDNIYLNASINIDNNHFSFPISGSLKASYKAQQGVNSIIVEVHETTAEFDVLLFEIYNDTAKDTLFLNSFIPNNQLTNTPHIKIYLQDQESNVFLFEQALPENLCGLTTSNYPVANVYKDLYWAWDLVKHTTTQIPVGTDIPSQYSIPSRSADGTNHVRTHDEIYYDSFYLLEDFYESYSLPYVEYSYNNVSSSDCTWTANFKISEHVELNGITISSGNAFSYHNVKVAYAGGANTKFVRTYQSGILLNSLGTILQNNARITIDLLKNTSTYASTFLAALECISQMTSSRKTTVLGTNGITLFSETVTAVGERLDNYHFVDSSENGGQYFLLHAVAQSYGATVTRETVGALVVDFDVECGTTIVDSDAIEIQLNYTVYAG